MFTLNGLVHENSDDDNSVEEENHICLLFLSHMASAGFTRYRLQTLRKAKHIKIYVRVIAPTESKRA